MRIMLHSPPFSRLRAGLAYVRRVNIFTKRELRFWRPKHKLPMNLFMFSFAVLSPQWHRRADAYACK